MQLCEALGLALVPKSARIESSGGHFGTQGADFEKKGSQNGPLFGQNLKKPIQKHKMSSPCGAPGADRCPRGSPKHPRPHFYRIFMDLGSIFDRPRLIVTDSSWSWAPFFIILDGILHGL